MGTRFKISRWKVMTAASALVLGISAAYAAITIGPDGVIHACYDKKGMLRIVASESSCTSNETPISWSQQGPQGEPGEKGDKGDQGEPGEQGPPGDTTPADPLMVGTVQIEGDTYPIFGFESSITVPPSDSGGGVSKPQFSRVLVQRDAEAGTPRLHVDTASGRHFRSVSIEVFTTPAADESLLVELEDVSLGLIHTTETPHAKTRETIGFDFAKITWTIGTATISYDRKRNEGGGGGDIENFFLLDRGGSADAFPSPAWSLARSFSEGIDRIADLSGGGAAKPTFQDLVIERTADVAVLNHLGNVVSGSHSQSSELDVTAPDDSGQAQAFLRYSLQDLLVTGVALKTDAGGNLNESLSLNGRRLQWEYVPDHEVGGWDKLLNEGL